MGLHPLPAQSNASSSGDGPDAGYPVLNQLTPLLPDLRRRLAADSKAIVNHGKPRREDVAPAEPAPDWHS